MKPSSLKAFVKYLVKALPWHNFYQSNPFRLKTRLKFCLTLLLPLFLVACTSSQIPNGIVPNSTPNSKLLVAAAASLQKSLQEITPLYHQAYPQQKITYNFAASGALAQQITQGAPVDVFISAATQQMQDLAAKELLLADSSTNLLTNQLVLITPKSNAISNSISSPLALQDFTDLTKPEVKRIAIGQPLTVPAGKYALEVLKSLGILPQVESKFILGNSVQSVLGAVRTGDVEAGIVYLTDAKSTDQVTIVAIALPSLHTPIRYPAAVIKSSKFPVQAKQYIEFLQTQPVKAIFQRYGFGTA
jgi:molybdate transport system substrate-binding protein